MPRDAEQEDTMSEYRTLKTKFKYRNELVAALEEIYGQGSVEVHNKPQHLLDYMGNERQETANIIVRRGYICGLSNDLGFVQKGEFYETIVDNFSSRNTKVSLKDIVEKYAGHVLKNKLSSKYRVLSTKEGNRFMVEQIY